MPIRLIAEDGPDRGRVYDVTARGTFLFGREGECSSGGELPSDPYCSRRHAQLEVCGDRVLVLDLRSRNGTWVAGARLAPEALRELQPGELLKIGRTVLRLEVTAAPPAARPSAVILPSPVPSPGWVEPSAPDVPPGHAPIGAPSVERSSSPPPARDATLRFPSRPPPSAPVIGLRRPLSDFQRGLKLGAGGVAVVYRARDTVTGAIVALKLLAPRRDLSPEAVALFLRETEVHASLSHPHVVAVVACGEDDGKPWLALAYVDGPDLERHVEASGPLAVGDAVRIGEGLLSALAYAHGRGVVHRGVKPSNVLLQGPPPWTALLADFGIAKSLQQVGAAPLTETNMVRGTVGYLAPEQLEDAKRAGPAADVYGAAASLYFALTGRSHLDGPLVGYQGFRTVLEGKAVPIRSRRADVPPGVAAAIDRGLSRKPADRLPSAEALRQALVP